MDNAPKSERPWATAGEVVLWVIFYFWAVWIVNAFLPPKPDRTPLETYLGKQLWQHDGSGAAVQARTQDPSELPDPMAPEGLRP